MSNLQPGLKGEARLVVDTPHLADQGGKGAAGVKVLGTPHLIGLMESAAFNAVQEHLPEGMVSVGTTVTMKHLAATPPGMTVTAGAELIEVDGRRLVYKIWADDEVERVSEGQHERFVVPLDKILERARSKAEKHSG